MKEDALSRAARAVRDSYDGASARSESTRRSLLARAALSRRRRQSIVLFVAPLAAALVLSTAWAAVTGRLPRWIGQSPSKPPSTAAVASSAAAPSTQPAAPLPSSILPAAPLASAATESREAPSELRPGADAPVPAAPTPSPASSDARTLRPRSGSPVIPSAAPASPAPAPSTTDAEETAYAAAHRLHFGGHDPAATLKAWDSYLATYPNGRFALEARYNRALTLVRLGRTDDARAALTPFANGNVSGASAGYRQREAQELLDALGSGP